MAPPPKSPHLYLIEDRGYETPCWVWQRAQNSGGYGVLRTGPGSKTLTLAHRKFWEDEHGPIPEGQEPDHLCRVKDCVRPSHLELVSHAENCQRGRSAILTAENVAEIRVRLRGGDQPAVLARAFGVSHHAIRGIRDGTRWARA